MPGLMLAIGAYLLALPFLPPQAASLVMLVIVLAFVIRPGDATPDPGWRFLLPLLPFAAAEVLAVLRAPDQVVASAVLSFMLPGLAIFIIMLRNPAWKLADWLTLWTGFAAVNALSVLAGWVLLRFSHPTQAMLGVPEGPLIFARSQLLMVPNDISLAAVLLACPLALVAAPAASRRVKALAWLTILLSALAIGLLRSRTAMLVAGVEIALISLAWRRVLLLLPPAAVLLLLADHWLGLQLLDKLLGLQGVGAHGVDGRLGLWQAAWAMFERAPLLGHGAQAYADQHGEYLPAWSPRFPERRAAWAHNLYLETLADQGIAGLAALSLIFYRALRDSCVLFVQGLRKGYIYHEGVFALAGLVGFLVAAGLELSFIRRWVPLVMFGLLGVCLKAAQNARSAGPS